MLDLEEHLQTGFNILTVDWVLVSVHRIKRSWQGKLEDLPKDEQPVYDYKCYLCSGNKRRMERIILNIQNPILSSMNFQPYWLIHLWEGMMRTAYCRLKADQRFVKGYLSPKKITLSFRKRLWKPLKSDWTLAE